MSRDFINSRTINQKFVEGLLLKRRKRRILKFYQQIVAGYKLMKMSANKETSCPYCLPASVFESFLFNLGEKNKGRTCVLFNHNI